MRKTRKIDQREIKLNQLINLKPTEIKKKWDIKCASENKALQAAKPFKSTDCETRTRNPSVINLVL